MALGWFGGSKAASIEELIARGKYGKAIEMLKARFQEGSRDPGLRQQLADVLALSGQGRQAVPILIGLADEFTAGGAAAKAIAVLKKIEKIEPGRSDVERRLASLIPAGGRAEAAGEPEPEGPAEDAFPESPGATAQRDEIEEMVVEPLSGGPAGDPLVDAIQQAIEGGPKVGPAPTHATPALTGNPLFSDFSPEELLAVIRGLRLLTYEAGDIVLTEGEEGDSLFVLTTGTAKAFVMNPAGRHVQVREMNEGAFFGEISILTGKPRTATITAASRCEMLELDRMTLESIAETHPGVREVLQQFYDQRARSPAEAMVRKMAFGQGRRRAEG